MCFRHTILAHIRIEILRVVTYEIILEDKSKYTASVSSPLKEKLSLHDVERDAVGHTILEAGNKTQYHIKQRLILSVAQVFAISGYSLSRIHKSSSESGEDYDDTKAIILHCLPLFLKNGGYEVYEQPALFPLTRA